MPRILRADNGEPLIERYVGPSPIGLMADPIPYVIPRDPYIGDGLASAGAGVALGISSSLAASPGFSIGTGDASGVGLAVAGSLGVGQGIGFASALAFGVAVFDGVGTAAGAGDAAAVPARSVAGVGAASGIGTATGDPSDTMIGSASGLGLASAVGRRLASSPGAAIGTGVASGISNAGGTGILSVVITRDSDGVNATYTEVGATDLGNYIDPLGQFTQGCKRAPANATFPNFYVHFRKDVGGTPRNEIIFEYGACFNGARSYMLAYHVSVRVDGGQVANIAVPYHPHFSRWRWNPSPRPIRTTGAALIAANMVPPLVTSQTNSLTAAPPTVSYSVMGLAGLSGDMTTPTDRYEIGMVTEHQAYWICTGLGSATVLAQGEASASLPWHHRDETTGGPINKTTYPQASEVNTNPANPYLAPDGSLDGTGGLPLIKTSLANHPSLAAVPFMMTGDPYYLEETQFCANWTALTQDWTLRAINSTSHILETGGELSAITASGWMSRTVAQALKITPTSVPSWLLPISYFQTYNDQITAYFSSRCITNPSAVYTLFRTIERVFGSSSDSGFTAGTYGSPYMEDLVSGAWSYAGVMHPTTPWVALANWKRGNAVARSNGTSGWEKAKPSPTRYKLRDTPTGTFYTTWGQSWTATQAIYNASFTSGVLDVSDQTAVNLGCHIRAAVAWGKVSTFNDATCNAPFTYLDTALMSAFNGSKFCSYKLAINPAISSVQTTATMTQGSTTATFNIANGTNMGNYVDPDGRFTMTCVRVTHASFPGVRVDFRSIPGWSCVIFEFGDASSSSDANMAAYTAVIGGQTINVPAHWKFARWRWQSGAWPFQMKPIADLYAAKLLPRFDNAVNRGTAGTHVADVYTPMGICGMYAQMGSGGPRPDIGLITDWQAEYVCTGSPTALSNTLAYGEVGGTVPWMVRDPATGGPVNVTTGTWGHASVYPGSGASPQLYGGATRGAAFVRFSGTPGATVDHPTWWVGGPITVNDTVSGQWNCYTTPITIPGAGFIDVKILFSGGSGQAPTGVITVDPSNVITSGPVTVTYVAGSYVPSSGIEIDIAHQPSLGYLPFLLTGDPYFLETLQASTIYTQLASPGGWASGSSSSPPGMGQTRAVAWATRDLIQSFVATPSVVPSWLLSKATMQTLMQRSITGLTAITQATEPLRALMRAVAGSRGSADLTDPNTGLVAHAGCTYATWQEDYVNLVIAWGSTLVPEFLPIVQWHVQGLISRLNIDGTNGWCGGVPELYYMIFQDTTAGPQYSTWTQAWTQNAAHHGWASCQTLATLLQDPASYDYVNGLQAGLSASWQAGVTAAKPALDVLATALEAGLVAHVGTKDYKWSLART